MPDCPAFFFWEKNPAISLPSKLKYAKMQMFMCFNREIQLLNANFVFKNWNVEIIQVSNWKVGSYIHSLYLISNFDIFMLDFSPDIVFSPIETHPIYSMLTLI